MGKEFNMPDYLFEVSWEVCNRVGGIHKILSTKALHLADQFNKKNHIHIGPDVWRDTEQNPEFVEDATLFKSWRLTASDEGLRIRIGHWNVPGNPIAILVDYTALMSRKDELLTSLWLDFGVDSLNGNWEYIESALFGYAAGQVIESFSLYYAKSHDNIVAQFHDWSTAAGLLYLKKKNLPVGTIFTTHATVLGRAIASRNIPFYDNIASFNVEEMVRECGEISRHSLEKAAASQADVFTTVSSITAVECLHFLGRECDVITPNGFENSFNPAPGKFEEAENKARKKLLQVASAMAGETFPEDAVLVGISGRYEYTSKGLDVFIDALDRFNRSGYNGRKVLAFAMVPSGNNGPDRELSAKLSGVENSHTTRVTHYLLDDYDIIMRRVGEIGIDNLFFIPANLNGNDGILNMTYYDLLSGLDLTLFPSYYEPWGYTPLESLAFKVPTVTTSLTGFGRWVEDNCRKEHPGILVAKRTDSNYEELVEMVSERIGEIASLSPSDRLKYKENAKEISSMALWVNLIVYYKMAYEQAINKLNSNRNNYADVLEEKHSYQKGVVSTPSWNSVLVSRRVPERLHNLEVLSMNLWWCWNQEAIDLFKSIDPDLWTSTKGNPLLVLDKISLKKYRQLEKDSAFISRLDEVYSHFKQYMEGKNDRKGPKVAYFCMEYGIDTSLKIYSGGLGILAGDYLKEASDMRVNMTAVGLLYRYGYFSQKLSAGGDQIADYEPQDFMKIPAVPVRNSEGNWLTVPIALPGRTMTARIWKVEVGLTDLYLLDTDFEDNRPEDRQVTHHLYGGDWENRLKQELLLGIGGIRALRALGIESQVYHCNEGHAAFCGIERLREYIQGDRLSFTEALEVVRSSSLFTTHTPVPAGHDAFSEDLLRVYISHIPDLLKIDWKSFLALGRINPDDSSEKFSMSYLAANLSQEVNGVSWLHGKVSQKIFAPMWPGYLPEELNVSSVTNGVHYDTWTAPEWKEIHASVFGEQFATHHYDKNCFEGIYNVPDKKIWETRRSLRTKLIDAVKDCMADTSVTSHYSPREIVKIRKTLRDDVLTIGFARRFATYKRAHLLFSNLDRLNEIVNNPERPVQFLFAGKAHPADGAGQGLIKQIIEISKMPQFIGKIVFIPNYDISIAKLLVQGVDVWMNNPTRPLEASGTSGEKAVMNGVMHFSVLDGWWVEGYRPDAGWALKQERTYDDQSYQNELDAATIYGIVETEIAPIFYAKEKNGISPEWIKIIKNTVAKVACNFTTNRMMNDYLDKYYVPLASRFTSLTDDDYSKARDIAYWKKNARRSWKHIDILSFTKPDDTREMLALGNGFNAELVASVGDMNPEDIGVEILFAEQDNMGEYHIKEKFEFQLVGFEDGIATYRSVIEPEFAGTYQVAGRIFAKNGNLPHRQDFDLVKWL